jgi:alpha-methylacyl-CoA racemase
MAGDPPLKGIRVLELAGLAPGNSNPIEHSIPFPLSNIPRIAPFCGLLLASYGASVLRIDRPHPLAYPPPPTQQTNPIPSPTESAVSAPFPPPTPDLLTAHKSSMCLNLKSASSRSLLLSLLPHTDILIDPFRPGVLENLDLDPQTVLLKHNPRLIVVRLTGFRRDGKYSNMAGHDINYLAVSGILSLLGPRGLPPQPPGNILADFAGGGLVAFTGILLALLQRGVAGKGQVVEANMVDGVSHLGTFARLGLKTPVWAGERGGNMLDGGAPFYAVYETKDSERYVAVGALEPQFFAELLAGLGLAEKEVLPPGIDGDRMDKRCWEFMKGVFEKKLREKTRKEWEQVFDGKDACVTPVLGMAELEREGYEQRPLVGLTESPARGAKYQWVPRPLRPGEGGEETLREWVGWRIGRDFDVEGGALVKMKRSRL